MLKKTLLAAITATPNIDRTYTYFFLGYVLVTFSLIEAKVKPYRTARANRLNFVSSLLLLHTFALNIS